MRPLRILVADDHEVMRDGVQVLVEQEPGWQVCGTATNGREAVEMAKKLLEKAKGKIKLPIDTVISDKMTDDAQTRVVEGDIPDDMEGFDIGPKTQAAYREQIAKANIEYQF